MACELCSNLTGGKFSPQSPPPFLGMSSLLSQSSGSIVFMGGKELHFMVGWLFEVC